MLSFVSMLLLFPLLRPEMFGVDGADTRTFMEVADERARPLKDVFDKFTNPESESLKRSIKLFSFKLVVTLFFLPLEQKLTIFFQAYTKERVVLAPIFSFVLLKVLLLTWCRAQVAYDYV